MSSVKKKSGVQLNPDMVFLRSLNASVGDSLKRCIQCGTCSATCAVSPLSSPFPRKEMAKATLGMKEALVSDPDVWLCYQCNDCSRRCPRTARPGDVLAAIRKESIVHFAFPRFLAKWVSTPRFLPILFIVPAAMLGLAIASRDQLARAFNIERDIGNDIVYSHSAFLPHWLLNRFFSVVVTYVFLTTTIGVVRFWRAMRHRALANGKYKKARSIPSSIAVALKQIIMHDKFDLCEATRPRLTAHFCVFFGFIALLVVASWIVSAGWNPLMNTEFVYPFSFLSPWKLLANLGGASLLGGLVMMTTARLKKNSDGGGSTYFDWFFLLALALVVVTGFATEGLHYLRMTPHRHVVYFIHLVLVTILLTSLPFTKFAHVIYRTVGIVFASHIGRDGEGQDVSPSNRKGNRDDE